VHRERPFFKDLVDFMISGPVLVQVLQGDNAILKNRERRRHGPEKAAGAPSAPTSPTRSTRIGTARMCRTRRAAKSLFFPATRSSALTPVHYPVTNLLGLDSQGMEQLLRRPGRGRSARHVPADPRRGAADFAAMTDIAKELRVKLNAAARIEPPAVATAR
jgi:hypothetical protein